jgi:hypothetical protein
MTEEGRNYATGGERTGREKQRIRYRNSVTKHTYTHTVIGIATLIVAIIQLFAQTAPQVWSQSRSPIECARRGKALFFARGHMLTPCRRVRVQLECSEPTMQD